VKPDGSPGIDLFTSLAHPWGAAPTYVLPEYLLGVAPTSPGYRTVLITPMVGFLNQSEVSGTVPTPNGPIKVAWTLSGTSVAFTIVIPTSTAATLQLPAGATAVGRSLRNGQLDLPCGTMELRIDMESDSWIEEER